LKRLSHAIETANVSSLALPALATGVGGLSWNAVKPLIEQNLSGLNIPIYVYTTYKPGVKAEETL
jgi:O-acetyl-ADP-ribose deacetylase (regulator of RNase III)